jgi:hypothetical protein
VLWWLLFFSATETRKHGITLKDLNQQALVGFSALAIWWLFFFLPRKHGNTEFHQKISKRKLWWALVLWSFGGNFFCHGSTETRNYTKRYYNEGFGEF